MKLTEKINKSLNEKKLNIKDAKKALKEFLNGNTAEYDSFEEWLYYNADSSYDDEQEYVGDIMGFVDKLLK